MESNPLLENLSLPSFTRIQPLHMQSAIDAVLNRNTSQLAELTGQEHITWQALFPVLEEMNDRLAKSWSPISHLNAVANNAEIRDAYNVCLAKVTDYGTMLAQHEDLYRLVKIVKNSPEFESLNGTQRKILDDALREFRLSGADLDQTRRQEFRRLSNELASLQAKFEENILDATRAWSLHIDDAEKLRGVPASDLDNARARATDKDLPGWLLTLDYPCYHAVMTFADNRALRNQMFEAYTTRASDTGPNGGEFDNTILLRDILGLRSQLAKLIEFDCYADYSLETKMASSASAVCEFLENLLINVQPQAQKEYAALGDYAASKLGLAELQPWDMAFATEKLRQENYAVDQEALRAYFPANHVLPGMFNIIGELYGLRITEVDQPDVWQQEVSLFEVFDEQEQRLGHLYVDLYAREGKRGGAWMDEYCDRYRSHDRLQTPVAFLVCNFSSPAADGEALLTHNDVITLFHEFGHCLHHLLTRIEHPSVAGINGVEWDAVELPSQFHENFAWEPATLQAISWHITTGEVLPTAMIDRLIAARNFHSALFLVRQLEFAIFDIELYTRNDSPDALQTWREVRKRVAVNALPDYHRFPHSFSHIFAGGYAAGYYGYLWAEVLANDAYYKVASAESPREEARRFKSIVLERGGSQTADELFHELMGREPDIASFLRHHGIGGTTE